MEGKENIKISLSTFFLFIALIVIVFLACFIIYITKENKQISTKNADLNNKLALLENKKVENTLKPETTTDINTSINSTTNTTTSETILSNKVEDSISTNDKVAICSLDNNHFYGYLDNGYLYYAIYSNMESQEFDNAPESKITKYKNLNNIKKIKYYNNGTSTSPYLVLLTEDGKLYTIDIYNSLEKNQINLDNATLLEETKNLNVKDFKVEIANYKFNLILTSNNGNTQTITLFDYPQ